MDKNKKHLATIFYILFYFWLLAIFVISSLPKVADPDVEWLSNLEIRLDYVFHFGAFGLLALFWCLAYFYKNGHFPLKKRFRIYLILVLFAALDETHQLFITGRTFNPIDLFFNELGLTVSVFGWPIAEKFLRKSRN